MKCSISSAIVGRKYYHRDPQRTCFSCQIEGLMSYCCHWVLKTMQFFQIEFFFFFYIFSCTVTMLRHTGDGVGAVSTRVGMVLGKLGTIRYGNRITFPYISLLCAVALKVVFFPLLRCSWVDFGNWPQTFLTVWRYILSKRLKVWNICFLEPCPGIWCQNDHLLLASLLSFYPHLVLSMIFS